MKDNEKKDRIPNRRCGFGQRSFSYAHHIPERRSGKDRRKSHECLPEFSDEVMLNSDSEKIQAALSFSEVTLTEQGIDPSEEASES